MPFLTALYHNMTPKLTTVAVILKITTETGSYNTGSVTGPSNYFTVELNSGDKWMIYSPEKVSVVVQTSTF